MKEGKLNGVKREVSAENWMPNRREFLEGSAALGLAGWTAQISGALAGTNAPSGLPARPSEPPLDFHALANAFDSWVMDPAHGLNSTSKDGRQVFPSALE